MPPPLRPHGPAGLAALAFLLLLLPGHGAADLTACYQQNGAVTGLLPCNPKAAVSHCCSVDDFCLDNGFCLNGGGNNGITLQGCTDPTWEGCKRPCPDPEGELWVYMSKCSPMGTDFCCGPFQSCCSNKTLVFDIPHFKNINKPMGVTIGGRFPPDSTSTSATNSAVTTTTRDPNKSSPTTSSGGDTTTTTPPAESTSAGTSGSGGGNNNNQAANTSSETGGIPSNTLALIVGLAVGVPLALILAAMIFYLVRLRQTMQGFVSAHHPPSAPSAAAFTDETKSVAAPVISPYPTQLPTDFPAHPGELPLSTVGARELPTEQLDYQDRLVNDRTPPAGGYYHGDTGYR